MVRFCSSTEFMSFQLCDKDCHRNANHFGTVWYRFVIAPALLHARISEQQCVMERQPLMWFYWSCFRVQRVALLNSGYMLMSQYTAPLPNFTHFLREDGLGTFILDIILRAPCFQHSLVGVFFA